MIAVYCLSLRRLTGQPKTPIALASISGCCRGTTLSYDQSLAYDKVDNVTTDQNLNFLLPGSVPVDLGTRLEYRGHHSVRHAIPHNDARLCKSGL